MAQYLRWSPAELYGETSLEQTMRKNIFPVWLGLAFLVLFSQILPAYVEVFAELVPTTGVYSVGVWLALALMASQRANLRYWSGLPGVTAVVDAYLLSLIATMAAVQLLPEWSALDMLEIGANAFGSVLFWTTIGSFILASFAFIIAPSKVLVQADHPVQYRDRENAAKFLLGAAGIVLLYKIIRLFL